MNKKLPTPAFKITRCPTCGSAAIRWVMQRWDYQTEKGRRLTPEVPHWKCGDCGERLFDRISHQVLDPWRASIRKKKSRSRASPIKKSSKARSKR